MEEIIVQGGNRLEGVVKVEGAKNAVLPILFYQMSLPLTTY